MSRTWLVDTAERVVLTAVETFLAVFVVTDLSSAKAAGVAAAAAGLSVLKAAVARLRGSSDSASLVE